MSTRCPSSEDQLRIAERVALGMSSAQVAAALTLSKATVNVQMSDSNAKTGVATRTALVHACYVTSQLARPELVTPAPVATEVERGDPLGPAGLGRLHWRRPAAGATTPPTWWTRSCGP